MSVVENVHELYERAGALPSRVRPAAHRAPRLTLTLRQRGVARVAHEDATARADALRFALEPISQK